MLKGYEEWGIVATIDPVDLNNSTAVTDIIDMSEWSELLFIIQLGVLNASATNTFTVYEDEASNMSGEAALSGKAQAIDGDDDGYQYIISVKDEELSAGCRYVRMKNAGSAHSQLASVIVLGRARYRPATDDDLSTVQTIVD